MMAPKRKGGKSKKTKQTLKFLASGPHPEITHHILRNADRALVKGICNAAYNVTKGEIPLTRRQKVLFAHHRPVLNALTTPQTSIEHKQKQIQQGGSLLATILPVVLGAVLTTVGSAIFQK